MANTAALTAEAEARVRAAFTPNRSQDAARRAGLDAAEAAEEAGATEDEIKAAYWNAYHAAT